MKKHSLCKITLLYNTYFLLSVSALLFSSSFVFPHYINFFVFLFLIPLFYLVVSNRNLSFKEGLWWGSLSFAVHYYAILPLIIEHAQGKLRFFAWFLLLIYFALHAGFWFLCSNWLTSYFKKRSIVIWSVTSLLYFYWMDQHLFWIFDVKCGTPFSSPLLPLAAHGQWLYCLPFIGRYILVLIIILASSAWAQWLVRRKTVYLLMGILLWIPFIVGWFFNWQEGTNELDEISFLIPPKATAYMYDLAQEIMQQLQTVKDIQPNVKLIIAPESTFPFCLNDEKKFLVMWHENALDDTHLFIGSHRREDSKIYNCLYWIYKGRIMFTYDKKHLMPFTEMIPKLMQPFVWLHSIFSNNTIFSRAQTVHNNEFCVGSKTFCPMICADLFFYDTKTENKKRSYTSLRSE